MLKVVEQIKEAVGAGSLWQARSRLSKCLIAHQGRFSITLVFWATVLKPGST